MDKITKFVTGATRNEQFYSPRFSSQKYFYANGVPVPRGTKLHHHTEPALGDNYFMTQHNMNGAVNVFTELGLRNGVPQNSRAVNGSSTTNVVRRRTLRPNSNVGGNNRGY